MNDVILSVAKDPGARGAMPAAAHALPRRSLAPLGMTAWLIAAAASAYACALAVPAATPIDRALPLVAMLVTLLAWSAESAAIQIAVPLLIVAGIAIPDERLRLLTYGVIVAAAFAGSMWRRPLRPPAGEAPAATPEQAAIVIAAVALLRWIPLDGIVYWREAIILGGALLVLHATRNAAAAILAAAATPLFPLKALAFPFLLAALAALLPQRFRLAAAIVFAALVPFARYSFAPLLIAAALAMLCSTTEAPAKVMALLLIVLFAWSGAAIHAMPPLFLAIVVGIALIGRLSPIVAAAGGLALIFCVPATTAFEKVPVDTALAPSQSLLFDVAPSRRIVITASGANVSSMRDGKLGTIEALDEKRNVIASRSIAIGDVADWGFMRREHLFTSRNRLPREPSWRLIGYGAESWFTGAGRITLDAPRHIEAVRITAAPSLPRAASLQIESIELPRR
ncbi:MAG: hypothetical protein JWO97_1800 [Acidobacteria bacterium]|nr:hypothetical protein [Acidobacteriota bacterium]